MNESATIPFLDLITPHHELRQELCEVFETALATAGFVGGAMVEGFERDFAQFCHTDHCVAVGSGTDALRFAFMASGIGRGDLVITVPHTFIATTEAITQAGARPVFVDIDEVTYNMDPVKLRRYVNEECGFNRAAGALIERRTGNRVSAVVPVHLYGQMADMDPILEVADEYKLLVIEDACQAHGAEYFSEKQSRWRKAGSIGRAAAFSFYPGKNLGACGEAGAVTTNDSVLAKKIRLLRDHGQATKYYHDVEGYNGRLDSIQAGILRVKLKYLSVWNEQRRQAAQRYRELFASTNGAVGPPFELSCARGVYHLYVVRVHERDQLQKRLAEENVGTGIHYPIPLHLQNAYRSLGYPEGSFPVTERVAAEVLSLPMFPSLSQAQQARVVQCLAESADGRAGAGKTFRSFGTVK